MSVDLLNVRNELELRTSKCFVRIASYLFMCSLKLYPRIVLKHACYKNDFRFKIGFIPTITFSGILRFIFTAMSLKKSIRDKSGRLAGY